MFWDSVRVGTAPCPSRSSGTKAAPALRRPVMEVRPSATPSRSSMPGATSRSPDTASKKLTLTVSSHASDGNDLTGIHDEVDVCEGHGKRTITGK
jgi:hypothetical protein